MRIATEIKAVYIMAISREALDDFLLRRYGQKYKEEGDELLSKAAKAYRDIGRADDAERVEERQVDKYRDCDKVKIARALIYDLDEGPDGQIFAVPTERLSAHRPS